MNKKKKKKKNVREYQLFLHSFFFLTSLQQFIIFSGREGERNEIGVIKPFLDGKWRNILSFGCVNGTKLNFLMEWMEEKEGEEEEEEEEEEEGGKGRGRRRRRGNE